ncbi:response regulator transcription factor [Mycobacterium sp. shizuoka-1]|uniref:response regulator transcription factor n=1 Tax=Mycobacterium sp. shizuoka-1 TaxID=2039281 RepID=UPI000C0657DF|nr:response regulator [Mycobacterium sp. shizuoka-1]GAY14083.1 response regulator [Mycobacterium sp. shizuoka-1]
MRCLIVDDSAQFRTTASTILARGGIAVVGMAANAADAVRTYRELHPDVTLVDVDLGEESGFDVVRALHDAGAPASAMILISTHAESDFTDLIAVSPVSGFLPKFAFSTQAVRELVGSG